MDPRSMAVFVAESIHVAIMELAALDGRRKAVAEQALGMWLNHETDPSIGVIVWMGKVFDVQIADRVTELPPDEISSLVGLAIINAYVAWCQHHRQLMSRIDQSPTAAEDGSSGAGRSGATSMTSRHDVGPTAVVGARVDDGGHG